SPRRARGRGPVPVWKRGSSGLPSEREVERESRGRERAARDEQDVSRRGCVLARLDVGDVARKIGPALIVGSVGAVDQRTPRPSFVDPDAADDDAEGEGGEARRTVPSRRG